MLISANVSPDTTPPTPEEQAASEASMLSVLDQLENGDSTPTPTGGGMRINVRSLRDDQVPPDIPSASESDDRDQRLADEFYRASYPQSQYSWVGSRQQPGIGYKRAADTPEKRNLVFPFTLLPPPLRALLETALYGGTVSASASNGTKKKDEGKDRSGKTGTMFFG